MVSVIVKENMRKLLAKEKEQRKKFIGTFSRVGKKTGYQGYSEDTILLKDIIDSETSTIVADHCWFNYTKGFESLILKEGVKVEFEARVKEYTKGYVNSALKINNKKKDYKLSHPTRIKLVE